MQADLRIYQTLIPDLEGFHEVIRIAALDGTARGTSGITTFEGKHPEATILQRGKTFF